jgi:predicted ArsR family transcriptional regulator
VFYLSKYDKSMSNGFAQKTHNRTGEFPMTAAGKEASASTQDSILRLMLHNKGGITVEKLAEGSAVTRTAVRQHLAAMERNGLVTRGATRPTGGRPEHLYVLTEAGREHFPRQYSWFAELLLVSLEEQAGKDGAAEGLSAMGRSVGSGLRGRVSGAPGSAEQLKQIAGAMTELGYDASIKSDKSETIIEAHNCVFHRLAEKNPDVCKFDLALLSEASGCRVEHRACMVRGGEACRFSFKKK